jgi:hypothetical protein
MNIRNGEVIAAKTLEIPQSHSFKVKIKVVGQIIS